VVTNVIEAPRLRDTELAGLEAEWVAVPWWDDRAVRLPRGPRVGWDRPVPGTGSADVGPALTAVRRVLTATQQQRLRELCADATAATVEAAHAVTPATTAYETAGLLAERLLARAADPVVLLVGGGEAPFRHPLPTTAPVGPRAMLVCCARRHGLVASVTRVVALRPLQPRHHDAYRRLLDVERVFLDASMVGARLGDVVRAGTQAYADHGFEPAEWHRHHQGGLSGLSPREYPAGPAADDVLTAGNVVAWNPSADGWKVEDTSLVCGASADLPAGAAGAEPLDRSPDWPVIDVGGRLRPDVLVR
jgi:antitoxin VapB